MLLFIVRSGFFLLGHGSTSASMSTPCCWLAGWRRREHCGDRCLKLCIWELTQLCQFCKINDYPRFDGFHAALDHVSGVRGQGWLSFPVCGNVGAQSCLLSSAHFAAYSLGAVSIRRPHERLDLFGAADTLPEPATGCCAGWMGSPSRCSLPAWCVTCRGTAGASRVATTGAMAAEGTLASALCAAALMTRD